MELAHVSDLHIRWRPGESGAPFARYLNKRVVGWLNLTFNRSHPLAVLSALVADLRESPPDHLAVTGDFTNLALPGEFARAREFLEATELSAEQVSVIPGNHDTYVRASVGRFEEVLADWLDPALGVDAWPRARRVGDLLLVGTQSCVPTPVFQAWGAMGERQLRALSEALEGDDAPVKLVLVHHPPLLAGGKPEKPRRGNRDARGLLEACVGRADAILCGHTHHAFHHVHEGLHVLCAGSSTSSVKALGEGATYNRYRIEQGQLLGYEVRGYDPSQGRFVHVREERLSEARVPSS